MELTDCTLCPRECHANRTAGPGYCGGAAKVKVARAALHKWEEPCISGEEGSGTIFFSGCSLGCCFCQNYKISAQNFGKEISVEELSQLFLKMQRQGASNINLVSAAHNVPWVIQALKRVKGGLHIPVVYNSGGYEKVETLRQLEGYVDVYLPDLKFVDSARSARYCQAPDYFQVASKAILEMYRQVGKVELDERGMIQKGMIIRHLVLPKGRFDSQAVLEWIKQALPVEEVLVSIMSQYTPFYHSAEYPELGRRISTFEYNYVVDCALDLGIQGFMQEKSSAKEEYTPEFNLQGIDD